LRATLPVASFLGTVLPPEVARQAGSPDLDMPPLEVSIPPLQFGSKGAVQLHGF
jgi:hypothetical protein